MTTDYNAVAATSAGAIMGEARELQGAHGASLIRAGLRRFKAAVSQLVVADRVGSEPRLRLH